MMKNLSDTELKKASILDFTNNLQELRDALDDETFEIEEAARWSPSDKMYSLLAYAEYKSDVKMLKRLQDLFDDELTAIFNE